MKPKKRLSAKAVQISKDQSQLLITVIVATLLSVFCLFSVKNLVAKSIYQGRVISARHKSADQIKTDIRNANTLVAQYKDVFIGDNGQNIIGGKNDANVYAIPPNGDNGRIVIDALPTSYNFPALLTSLQQMMNSNNLGSQSIGGTDQTATADNSPSGSPKPDKKSKVPTAENISTSFPDVKNDPTYNSIFNASALDPALPIKVDSNQQTQPFNGSQ
jgi:hypothetical protein